MVLLAAGLALFSVSASAQGYGRISGMVTDASGAAISGAHVTATQTSTGLNAATTTAGDGTYVFPSMRPAQYDITVSGSGFGNYEQRGITVQADAAVTVNVVLKVGQQSESVTVNADASQVDTTTATLSQVVPQDLINDLPLNGRNAASLTTLVSGVVVAPNAQADQGLTKTFPVVVAVTANGSRVGQTNYMLDGGNNLDEYTNVNAPFPFPDALQEFSVQTSNYSAAYGQNAGGVVNIITKGGTNRYHGDVFEYVRNAIFNAPNWFNPTKAVDPLKRNQFGGTIGGPFRLPGVQTPHSYFFAGYQRTVLRNNALTNTAAVLPTPAQLNGTFNVKNQAGCLKNPFTGALYPCTAVGSSPGVSTIDPTTYDSPSVKLLKYLPQGDPSSGTFFFNKPTRQNLDEVVGRFDQDLGANDRLTARYYYDRFHNGGVLDLTDLLTYSDQATITYQNFLISESHVFSNRVLNNFVANYQRDAAARGPLPGGISVSDLGVNMWQPAFKQINQIQASGFFTIGDNPAANFHRFNYNLADDLHWVHNSHNLAFGFHTEWSHVDINNQFRQPGFFTFDATNSGNAIANFLLGYMTNFQQASGQFFNNRGHYYGVYGADTWKVNRKLTLTYGLRWEPFVPWNEVKNRMGEFSPAGFAAGTHSSVYPNAPAGLLFVGDSGVNRYGIRHVYHDFMPRIGFAWDIFGDGKTSLRGGAGSFYDTRLSSVFNNIYSNGSPFVTTVNVTLPAAANSGAKFSNPYAGMNNPFPAPQPAPSTTTFPTQNYLTFDPYHQFDVPVFFSWNLTLERQVTGSALVRLAYVGASGEHLWAPVELNFTSYNAATNTQSPRLYAPTYTQPITEANYGANSNYNSLQASFEQRLRRGLSVMANYTWSKALDNLPWNASVTAIGPSNSYVYPVYVPNFKSLDYGPSDFDHRNVLSLSYVWELPKISGGGALRYIVNGWQTNGIFQFRSGDRLTIFSNASNNSRSDQMRDRAVGVPGVDAYGSTACAGVKTPCKPFLNPVAYSVNPVGTFGNARKGSLSGPQYANWDASLMRHFNFTERWQLEFRAEYFNVLNHPNFGDPSTTAGASTYGRITSTATSNGSSTQYDPRIGQLSLKLYF
jgi:hypothetical protein